MSASKPDWLEFARDLQAIAQNGLAFTEGHFDRLRYQQVATVAARMFADLSHSTPAMIGDLFAAQTGYATPKVDVRGVVMRDEAMLFVRERSDGCWTLPGGWAEPGISPAKCVEKEIREESGFLTRAEKLLGVLDRAQHAHPPFPFAVYKLFFRCTLIGGEACASDETSAVAFFKIDEVPELSRGRVNQAQIMRMFEHIAHSDWPADFD